MANNNFNNQTHYPRNEVRSELATKQTTKDNTILDFTTKAEQKAMELKAKNYNYTSIYAYLMDLICAFVTDYRLVEGAITELDNNYYMMTLKRETVEKYGFGPYTKVRSKFWKELYKVIAEPKTLYMYTDEGEFLGEPIHLTAKLQDGTILKSKNFENLQNATQMIEYLQIEFFKPMFKPVVEHHENWIPLPRYLQAIIDTELITNPAIAEWQAQSRYHTYEIENLTSQQIRLYFLYMTDHNNNIGDFMNINAIEFWQCVHAHNVNKRKITDDKGEHDFLYLTDWNKSRYEFNALARFHSHLAKKGLIDGINFTTCQAWYEPKNRTYRVAITRKQPLRNAPAYIEYDETKLIALPAKDDTPDLQSEYNKYAWEHDEYIDFETFVYMKKREQAFIEGLQGNTTDTTSNNNDFPEDIPF